MCTSSTGASEKEQANHNEETVTGSVGSADPEPVVVLFTSSKNLLFPGILLQGFVANRAGAQLHCHVGEGQHRLVSTQSCILGTMTSRPGKADTEVCSGLYCG